MLSLQPETKDPGLLGQLFFLVNLWGYWSWRTVKLGEADSIGVHCLRKASLVEGMSYPDEVGVPSGLRVQSDLQLVVTF